MNLRAINRYGAYPVLGLFAAYLLYAQFPNPVQVGLAESTSDDLMRQSQQNVQELLMIGQGFDKSDLREVEGLAATYGEIENFRRTGSHRQFGGVSVDYEVTRSRTRTLERVQLRAGWTRSYSRDFAIVDRHQVISATPLR
ncbi:MAG: hypothetical protein EON58_06610 [Alphaproteobacteria bacterium]|nr:MAG: hypothetical protein EON58_06610 [Alphaproteobacteria bacterium]